MTSHDKAEQAKKVIEDCRTERGFFASTQYYPELWVRDLVYSEDVLLRLGYAETVRKHLEAFLDRQRPSGQVPTVITTPLRGIFNQAFHSWTSDTEILLIISVWKYAKFTDDSDFLKKHEPQMSRCLRFIEGRLDEFGLMPGMDWRDATPNYRGRTLLANQVLLVEMYDLMQKREMSEPLRERIAQAFYLREQGYYADSIYRNEGGVTREAHFDSLGNSLAILSDVFPDVSAESVARVFEQCRTPHGYRNLYPPYRIKRIGSLTSVQDLNAFVRNGAIFRNRVGNYQNSTIWPFVEARIRRAFLKVGLDREAELIANMLLSRKGLNEWYSPTTGEPRGSKGQLWTAAAALEMTQRTS
jgi:glycogen debranching enzyme